MQGPRAFLVSVGATVALLGLLVLLAVPAARHMDAKALEQRGPQARQGRVAKVVTAGTVGVAVGVGVVLWGYLLRPKSRP